MREKSSLRKRMKVNQKLFIFLFFLVISTIFWFLNALDKEYITEISYPIVFKRLPKDKILTGNSSKEIILKINARGFTIVKHRISQQFLPVILDYTLIPVLQFSRNDNNKMYIISQTLRDEIASQLSSNIRILEILPDTLFIQLTETKRKKVPIRFDGQIEFEKQFMQRDILSFDPDSVTIIGPGNILDTITYTETVPTHILSLDKTITKEVQLKNIPDVNIAPEIVQFTIPVEKYTESSVVVPVDIENLPPDLNMKLFPAKVVVSYNVGFSNFEKVTPDKFRVVIYYDDIHKQRKKLKVRIVKYPEYVRSMLVNPENVEYIIEK